MKIAIVLMYTVSPRFGLSRMSVSLGTIIKHSHEIKRFLKKGVRVSLRIRSMHEDGMVLSMYTDGGCLHGFHGLPADLVHNQRDRPEVVDWWVGCKLPR
ncbi:MAG: hypothetical protein JXA20_10075 [Spirochaetes bacterium]|nr:hypothetical protein [Spirochaetota bacterium]